VGASRTFTIGAGGGTVSIGNNVSNSFGTRFTLNGPLTISNQGGSGVQSFGAIGGGGDLIISNTGTGTGAIAASASSAFGATIPVAFASNSNTKRLRLNGYSVTVGGLSTGATVGTSIVESNSGTAGTDTLTVVRNTTDQTFAGVLQDGSTRKLALKKDGTNTLTLSGTNTFTGGVTISNGVLAIGSTGALNSTTPNAVTFAASAPSGTKLALNGNSVAVSSLSSTSTNPVVENANAAAATLTLGLAGSSTYGGIFQDGSGGGALSFVKNGAGTFTLSSAGSSTYTGTTTVNAGTLLIDFANMATPTNVGSAASAVTLNGATLSVKGKSGGNVSAQTIAALTINNAASAIVIDPNEGTSATLTITSTAVNRTAPAMLNFNTSAGTPATAMIAWNPTPTGGIIGAPYTITDNGGTGFAAVSAGYVVRYTGATPLTATNPTSASTDFSASGAVTNTVAPTAQLNSLAIDTSGGAGSWDLGTSTAEVTTGGLLMTGGSNYTISNGSLKSITPSNSDLAVNQFGTGVLEIAATIVDGNGASTLTKTGPGKLVLSANNGYTGVSYVNAGTLQIGNAGAAGSVIGNIVNNAAVIINRTTDLTYAGVVSGTGSLTQAGSATLILTNVNTYSGGTTISAGTLQLGDGTTNGSIVGNVTDNATFAFANPTAQTFSGAISGTGSLTKGAAGVLTLSGTNSYQGSTTITAGTISIAADANLGTAPGGATPASIVLNGGALSATASFPLSTYRGVALGPAGGSGTGTIDVASGMTLTYGGIIANNTGGTGALSKTGAGVLYVTAQATHSGGTTLGADSGRLEYNVGSNVAFGTGGVTLGGGSYRRREYCGTTTNRTDATPFSIGASGGTIAASNDNFTSGNLNLTLSGAFTGSGTVTLDAGGGLPQSGSQTTNGSIFLSGDNSGFSGTMSLSRTTGSGCFRFNNANALNVINDGSIQWTGTGYPVGVVFNAMEAQLNKLAPGPNCTVGIDGITSNIDLTSPTLGWANKGTVRLGASQNTTYAGQVTANLVYKFSAVSGVTLTLSHADALTGSTAATLYAVNGNGGIVAVSETNASYSGAITVNANAVLQIGAGGAAGGIGTGSVVNNGTLQFNRSGSFLTFSNNISGSGTVTQSGTPTLLTLTGTNTHSVSTTVSGGALATNTTGLSSANLNLSGGVFLLDGTGADSLTWAQFAANRSLGYGGGASQWQITGAGGGFAARNADVTIDSSASTNTSFDNSFTLGMYQKSGGNLIANKAVNINRQITLSAATDRTWNVLGGVQGQAVGAATYWNVSGPVNEISGKITGGASGRILSFENSNGTQGTGGIVRLSNTANDFTANIRIGTATQYAPVLIVPDIAVLGNAANTVTLGKIATDYAGGLLLFEDQAGTGKSFTKNLAIGHQRSGGTLSGFGAYAGQVTYTGTVSGNFSGAGGQPFADAVHVQSGATMTLGDVSPAIFKQVTPAVGSGGLGLYKSGAGTLILNNVQYLASDSTDNSGRSPWMVVGGALRETGSTATTSAVNNSYSGGTMAGVYLSGGVLEFGATPRPLSLGNGVGQIRFDGNGQVINNDNTIYLSNANGGGFSAYGADRTVSLNAGAALTWAGTTGTSAYFVRNGAPLIFGSQTANATLIFQNDINLNTAVREIRVNKSLTSGDSARLTGVLSGTGASGVNKTGAGTLVLSGTNSYTGATNVNQGTLLVNGNQSAATGAVTVASTATLGGTGTIGGAVTVQNGGTVQPGTSPGTLTLASGVSIAAGATMNWQHNAGNALGTPGADPGYSTINLTGGSATIDNTPTTGSLLKLSFASGTSFADSFWDSGHSWNIITGGLSAGNFFDASNITVYVNNVQQDTGNTIPGQGSFTSQVSGNNLELDWTASTVGPVNSTWTGLSSPPDANWSTPGNWSAGVPDGPGATASFTGATPAAVALDGVVNRTLGHLNLSGTTGYTIGTLGGNKLRMDNTGGSPSGNATISAAFGAHTIAAQVVTTSASDLDISAPTGGGLSLTGGIDNAAAKALGLAQSGEGALEVGSILNAGTMTVSGTVGVKAVSSGTGANTTIVSASANLTATSIVQDTLTINAGGSVTIRETTVLAGSGAGASPVPEPGTWVLVGIGLLSLLAFRRRR
jgi:fibronectin-binding autotransporter adhesin